MNMERTWRTFGKEEIANDIAVEGNILPAPLVETL